MLTDSAAVVIGEDSRFIRFVNRFVARLQLADHEALEQASGEILDTRCSSEFRFAGGSVRFLSIPTVIKKIAICLNSVR